MRGIPITGSDRRAAREPRRPVGLEPAEGAKRMRAMRRHLAKNDLEHWASSFFEALQAQA